MRILSGRAAAAKVKIVAARSGQFNDLEPKVRRIIKDVRQGGDRALRRYAQRLDGLAKDGNLRVRETSLQSAWRTAPAELRTALQQAARNIRAFCDRQKPKEWTQKRDGISLGQLVRPLQSVGCYVPGGRHPGRIGSRVVATPLKLIDDFDFYILQFYNGFGNLNPRASGPHYSDVATAFPTRTAKLVAGVLTNKEDGGSGYNSLTALTNELANLVKAYPNFGGISGWTYQHALNAAGQIDPRGWAKAVWGQLQTPGVAATPDGRTLATVVE